MFARSRFQIGPSKQFQNNRCLALRRPPSCARQRRRFRRLLSRPPGSFRSPGIGSLCVGHAFPPSEHFLYKCSQRAVQRNSGPGEDCGWLRLFCRQLVKAHLQRRTSTFTAARLTFNRCLSLALEFQLASDILSTAVAPTWDEIGKLAATAVIPNSTEL